MWPKQKKKGLSPFSSVFADRGTIEFISQSCNLSQTNFVMLLMTFTSGWAISL